MVSLALCGCTTRMERPTQSTGPSPAGQARAKYTIMVYMNGSDLETMAGFGTQDLDEMMRAGYGDDINVVVQTGGTEYWWKRAIPDSSCARLQIKGGLLNELEDIGLQNMGEPASLTDFIDHSMERFPAERYGLVLWGHGSGSAYGLLWDDHFYGDGLTLDELRDALADSQAASHKLEFIGFDCCLMASVETANAVQDYASYLIASPEITPGYGWDYENWLSALGDRPDMGGQEIGRVVADGFVDFYSENELEGMSLTLSVIDLSKTDAVVSALEDFVASTSLGSLGYREVARPRSRAKEFGLDIFSSRTDMVDIVHLAAQFEAICPEQCKALSAAAKEAIAYNYSGKYTDNSNGLSIYFPYGEYRENMPYALSFYKDIGFSNKYTAFVHSFARMLTGRPMQGMAAIEAMVPQLDEDDRFYIDLTEEQLANIDKISFTAWSPLEGETYARVFKGSDLQIDGNNRVTCVTNGLFMLINGYEVSLNEIESGDNYTRYGVRALLNDDYVNLIIMVNEEYPNGKVLGAIPMGVYSEAAAGSMMSIEDGDEVIFLYSCMEFVDAVEEDYIDSGEEDSSYHEQYDEWFNMIETDPITVDGGLVVEALPQPEQEYIFGFTVLDLQQNEYWTIFSAYTEDGSAALPNTPAA